MENSIKTNQDKFYAHKVGEHIYITSRRQIVHGEYFMRNNEIYRYDGSNEAIVGRVNSNPIIGCTDFMFGYTNVGTDEEGSTIANQIGGGNGIRVNKPLVCNIPKEFVAFYEKYKSIYEVKVEFFESNSDTIKTVTPV